MSHDYKVMSLILHITSPITSIVILHKLYIVFLSPISMEHTHTKEVKPIIHKESHIRIYIGFTTTNTLTKVCWIFQKRVTAK